jgi:hypothetical protein
MLWYSLSQPRWHVGDAELHIVSRCCPCVYLKSLPDCASTICHSHTITFRPVARLLAGLRGSMSSRALCMHASASSTAARVLIISPCNCSWPLLRTRLLQPKAPKQRITSDGVAVSDQTPDAICRLLQLLLRMPVAAPLFVLSRAVSVAPTVYTNKSHIL